MTKCFEMSWTQLRVVLFLAVCYLPSRIFLMINVNLALGFIAGHKIYDAE